MNALMLTYSGFQDQEVIYPYYRLKGAGFNVDIISDKKDILGRTYGIFGVNMPCSDTYESFFQSTKSNVDSWNLLVLPGGVKSLEKLRQNKKVIEFISKWHKKGKVIASTCHGAQLLISAKIVNGMKIAGYYSIEDDIVNAGAVYSNAPFITDKNLVTSPHYDFMGEWMEEVIRVFSKINLENS